MAPVRTYKHPNCIKFNRTTHYKDDCWERNPDNALKVISDKIRARKKLRTTQASIQLDEHFGRAELNTNP